MTDLLRHAPFHLDQAAIDWVIATKAAMTPHYLYDAPRAPTYVNAYTTMVPMQQAVVECLLGRAAWNRNNPVDPFCGLPDARF